MVEKVFQNERKNKDTFNRRDTFYEHSHADIMLGKRPVIEVSTGWVVIPKDGEPRPAKPNEVPKKIGYGIKPQDGIPEDEILADMLPDPIRTKRKRK